MDAPWRALVLASILWEVLSAWTQDVNPECPPSSQCWYTCQVTVPTRKRWKRKACLSCLWAQRRVWNYSATEARVSINISKSMWQALAKTFWNVNILLETTPRMSWGDMWEFRWEGKQEWGFTREPFLPSGEEPALPSGGQSLGQM